MYDNSLHFSGVAEKNSDLVSKLNLKDKEFILATIHRNNNTDVPANLTALFSAINEIAITNNLPVVLPLHPRTAKLLQSNLNKDLYEKVTTNPLLKVIEPASFLEMIDLEKNCTLVMTDSGGVQKEAFYFEKPCIILRPETEWVELVDCGSAIVTDANETRIKEAFAKLYNNKNLVYPKYYGDGNAAEFICREIVGCFGS